MIDAANVMARAFDEFIILSQNLSIRLIRGSCGDHSACCTAHNGSDRPTNNRTADDQPWRQQPAFVGRMRPTSEMTVSRDRTCALRNHRNCSRLVRQAYFSSFAKANELTLEALGRFPKDRRHRMPASGKANGSPRASPNRSYARLGKRGRDHTGKGLGSALAREPQWHTLTLAAVDVGEPPAPPEWRLQNGVAPVAGAMRLIEPQASQRPRQRRWPNPNNGSAARAPSRK